MAAAIRLQFLVEGNAKAVGDVGDMVNGITSQFAKIGPALKSTFEVAAKDITENLNKIAAAVGPSFMSAIGKIGEMNEGVRLLNASTAQLAGNLSGIKFPSGGFSGGVSAGSAVAAATSGPSAAINVATAVAQGQSDAILKRMQDIVAVQAGERRNAGTTPAGNQFVTPYTAEDGTRYVLKELENVAKSLKPVSDGLMSPETQRRTNDLIQGFLNKQTSVVPGSNTRRGFDTGQGELFGRQYQEANGQLWNAQYRMVGGEEQLLRAKPVGGPAPIQTLADLFPNLSVRGPVEGTQFDWTPRKGTTLGEKLSQDTNYLRQQQYALGGGAPGSAEDVAAYGGGFGQRGGAGGVQSIIGYHGSDSEFDQFNIANAKGGTFGPGNYFGTDKDLASTYGKNLYTAQLSPQNPFQMGDKSDPEAIAKLNSLASSLGFNPFNPSDGSTNLDALRSLREANAGRDVNPVLRGAGYDSIIDKNIVSMLGDEGINLLSRQGPGGTKEFNAPINSERLPVEGVATRAEFDAHVRNYQADQASARFGNGIRKDDAESRADELVSSMGMDEGSYDKADAMAKKAQEKLSAGMERLAVAELKRWSAAMDAEEEAGPTPNLGALNAANRESLQGFKLGTTSIGPDGKPASQNYSKAAGFRSNAESATLNLNTGEMTRQIQEASSQWAKFSSRVFGDGPLLSKVANGFGSALSGGMRGALAPIKAISSAWQSLGNTMIRVSAMFYSFERIGNIIERAFLGPYEKINQATEAALKFRQSIAGTVGGMGNAGIVDDQMIALSRNLPLTLEQTRHMAELVTQVSSIAPQLAMSAPQQSGAVVGQFTDIATRMSISNPNASQDEIVKAIGNALEGNLRGLRLVARINPADLSAISGLSQKELQGNQTALLSAIEGVMRGRVSDKTMQEREMLPSVQWEKFVEQFQVGLQRIGLDSGMYENIANRFHGMMEQMAGYVDSPRFRERAKAIGDDLGHIFDNAMTSGAHLLQSMSGAASAATTPDEVASQIEDMIHRLSDASDDLPGIADGIGGTLHVLIDDLWEFMDDLKGIHNLMHGNAPSGDSIPEAVAMTAGRGMRIAAGWVADAAARGMGTVMGSPMARDAESTTTPGVSQDDGASTLSAYQVELQKNLKAQLSSDESDGLAERSSAAMLSLATRTGKLKDEFPTEKDKLGKAQAAGDEAFGSLYSQYDIGGGKMGNQFDQARQFIGQQDVSGMLGKIDTAMANITALQKISVEESAGRVKPGTVGYIEPTTIDKQEVELGKKIDGWYLSIDAVGDATGKLQEYLRDAASGAASWGAMMVEASKGLDPLIRYGNMQLYSSGQGSNQLQTYAEMQGISLAGSKDQLATIVENNDGFKGMSRAQSLADIQAKVGFGNMNPKIQAADLQERTAAGLANIQAWGGVNRTPEASSLMFGEGTAGKQADFLDGQLTQAVGLYDTAQGTYDAAGSGAKKDEAKLAMQEAAAEVVNLQTQIGKLREATNGAMQGFVKFGNEVQNDLESSLGKALDDILTKSKSLKDVWKDLGKSVVSQFSQMTSHTIGNSLFGDTSKGGGFGGILGDVGSMLQTPAKTDANGNPIQPAGGAAPKAPGGIFGLLMQGIGGMFGGGGGGGADFTPPTDGFDPGALSLDVDALAANGAVFPGGFQPFAGGGIVNKPTLGLVGERTDGTPEGVIPLLGRGNTIPLGMDSGGPHAMLPGGRRIAASFGMADGGVVAGGFDGLAFADGGVAAGGFTRARGGSGSTSQSVTIYHVNNVDEAIAKGYDKNKGHILDAVISEGRPGGKLRRVLAKTG